MVVTLSRSRALDSSSWPFRSVIGLYVVAASGPLPAPPVPLPTSRPCMPGTKAGTTTAMATAATPIRPLSRPAGVGPPAVSGAGAATPADPSPYAAVAALVRHPVSYTHLRAHET